MIPNTLKFIAKSLASINHFNPGVPGVSGSVNGDREAEITLKEDLINEDLFGSAYATVIATTTYSIEDLPAIQGGTLELAALHGLQVNIRRTAATVSGSFAIVCTGLGLSSGTISLGAAPLLTQVPIGGIMQTYLIAGIHPVSNGSGAEVTVTLTSPVGFEVDLAISGQTVV